MTVFRKKDVPLLCRPLPTVENYLSLCYNRSKQNLRQNFFKKIFKKNFRPPSYFENNIDYMGEGITRGADCTERSPMNDRKIIELMWERSETALCELSQKYSRLYKAVLREILGDDSDADECANDVLLAVWNSIPPNRPDSLPSYVCKLARRIGIDRLRHNTRQKRNTGYTIMLSELEDCLPSEEPSDDAEERSELIRSVLSDFVRGLDPETEILFIRRYIYLESVTELAERFEMKENHVSVKLYRARKKLKKLLEKEGISL